MQNAVNGQAKFIENMSIGIFDPHKKLTFIPYADSLDEIQERVSSNYDDLELFEFKTREGDDSSISIHQGVNGVALSPQTMGILGLNHGQSTFFYSLTVAKSEFIVTLHLVLSDNDNKKLRKSLDQKLINSLEFLEKADLSASLKDALRAVF